MRQVRTFRCKSCNTPIELVDQRDDDQFAAMGVRNWQCPGCCMHVTGRPRAGRGGGVSGVPMWLADQFWTTERLRDDPALLDHLFATTRAALAAAAATELAREDVEPHARATILQILRGLRAPLVPPHPALAALLDAAATPGAAGVAWLWRSFVEHPHATRTDVTFRVRPPTKAGMFAFEYRALPGSEVFRLRNCYTVWRSLPDGMEP